MEQPRIVYCKPKSKQFIGSYQSEVISSVCLPEIDYNLSSEMFNKNNNSFDTSDLTTTFDKNMSSDQDQEKGNFIINT